MRKLVQVILKRLSMLILWKYRPTIIAVTGSVGKSSTKEAISSVVKTKFSARRSQLSYNNEIGVPLTVIGELSGGRNLLAWLWIFLKAFFLILFPFPYPKVLILEMGADRPGDIGYLTSFVKPDITVVTSVGPSHLEYFGRIEKTAQEKAKLVSALTPRGTAVLNYDEPFVRRMAEKHRGQTIFYGLDRQAQVYATDFLFNREGQSFKVHYLGNVVPVHLAEVLGKPAIYAALAAMAVGQVLDINLVEASRALEPFQGLPGRLRLLPGIKQTLILDDSYNAAPASAFAALEVLALLPGKRKIAVLGDMTELGAATEDGHRTVGAAVVDRGINFLVTVGARAKFISDQATHMGYPKDRLAGFDTAAEAGKFVQDLVKPGDVILVKGSRVMAMEKIVKEIMALPEQAHALLVH